MVITNVNQVVYQGDGVTTAFPFTFRIIDWTDIKLLLLDSDGTETDITSDYYVDTVNNTVHYPGYAPGAEPALSNRPPVLAEGQKLVIYRKLPITQEKYLGDKWPFSVIELGLDKLTMILQDIWDWLGRCLYVSKGQAYEAGNDFDPTIPLEADKVICGNANGTGFDAREAMMEVNGAWDGENRSIVNIAQPDQPDDAATKRYIDNLISSLQALGSEGVIFNTVADMRVNRLLVPGQTAMTKGYLKIYDSGASIYNIRAKTYSDRDDGKKIVILGNNNVAERIAHIGVTNFFELDEDTGALYQIVEE